MFEAEKDRSNESLAESRRGSRQVSQKETDESFATAMDSFSLRWESRRESSTSKKERKSYATFPIQDSIDGAEVLVSRDSSRYHNLPLLSLPRSKKTPRVTSGQSLDDLGVGNGMPRSVPIDAPRELNLPKQARSFLRIICISESARLDIVYWLVRSFDWAALQLALAQLLHLIKRVDPMDREPLRQRIRSLIEALHLSASLCKTDIEVARKEKLVQLEKEIRPVISPFRRPNVESHEFSFSNLSDTGSTQRELAHLKWDHQEVRFLVTRYARLSRAEACIEKLRTLLHPNILSTHFLFPDGSQLLRLEDEPNQGSLLDMLRAKQERRGRKGWYNEAIPRFWTSRVLLAVKYLHDRRMPHGMVRVDSIFCVSSRIPCDIKLPGPMLTQLLSPCESHFRADLRAVGELVYYLLSGKSIPMVGNPTGSLKKLSHVSNHGQDLCASLLNASNHSLLAEDFLRHPWFSTNDDALSNYELQIDWNDSATKSHGGPGFNPFCGLLAGIC